MTNALKECPDVFKWPPEIAEFKELCTKHERYRKPTYNPYERTIEHKPIYRDLNVQKIIDNGAVVCKKLKEIYPELSWMSISNKFTALKKASRKYYPKLNEVQFLDKLTKYTNHDIAEALKID